MCSAWIKKEAHAFTLAEVLVTLGIIGVVAAMTLPSVISSRHEKENVVRLEKFVSTLSQAINLYKAKEECLGNISDCLPFAEDSDCRTFSGIAAEMRIVDSVSREKNETRDWLPDKYYNYYGENPEESGATSYFGISKKKFGDCAYLLQDGTTFSIDANPSSFNLIVDVNGPLKPNRVGRDIFFFYIGNVWGSSTIEDRAERKYFINNDITPYPAYDLSRYSSYKGMCFIESKKRVECNVDNLDPNKDGGASITAYTLYYKKLPPIYTGN